MSCDTSVDPLPNTPECVKACLDDPTLDCPIGSILEQKNICNTSYDLESIPSKCCEISSFNDEIAQTLCAKKCMESDNFSLGTCGNVKRKIEEYCETNLNAKCCSEDYRGLQEDACQEVFPIKYNFNLECAGNGKVKFTPTNIDVRRENTLRYFNCEEDPSEQTLGDFDFKCLSDNTLEVNQNNFSDNSIQNKKSLKCANIDNSNNNSDTFKVTNNNGKINITCGNKTQEITCENNKTTTNNCGSMFLAGLFVGIFGVLIIYTILKGKKAKKFSFGVQF